MSDLNNHQIFFSVIIPTYNREKVLERAIDSVLNQSFKDFELIVVDDGSTDQTSEILKKYDKNIKVIRTENKGVSAARNLGVQHASGIWLSFLDSDDEWLKFKLQKQAQFIIENPNTPLVHGEEIWIRNGRRVNQKNKHQKYGGRIFQKCLPLCLISPSAVSIRKDIYLENGGFDEEFIVCEDYDLWLKLTSLYEVGFIEEPIINKYGGHDDQLSARYKAMDLYRLKSMLRIMEIRNLEEEDLRACKIEVLKKAEILQKGFEKHGNTSKVREVQSLVAGVSL